MKKMMKMLMIMTLLFSLIGCNDAVEFNNDLDIDFGDLSTEATFDTSDYQSLVVEGGDQSGHREANVVVDIGFGDRKYYAYTNDFGQLIRVEANQIILQDDKNEPVNKDGRYYPDEAKVPGVEHKDLDEGHVIADSLGGVANAYNITPQNSTINRHGDQAYMEKVIREAGGCKNFLAIITYPNTETQIPSHYEISYEINGEKIVDSFDNINPEDHVVHSKLKDSVKIIDVDKRAEWITIKNTTSQAIDITGWQIVSVRGNQRFTIPTFTLEPNQVIKIGDAAKNSDVDFHWLDGSGVWSNSKSDPAELYDDKNQLVNRLADE